MKVPKYLKPLRQMILFVSPLEHRDDRATLSTLHSDHRCSNPYRAAPKVGYSQQLASPPRTLLHIARVKSTTFFSASIAH